MSVDIYYTDTSGNLVRESYGTGNRNRTELVTPNQWEGSIDEVKNPARMDTVITNAIKSNVQLGEKVIQAAQVSDASVVQQAMQSWKETFDKATQDVITASEPYQATQAEGYQPYYGPPDQDQGGDDYDGTTGTVNRADAEALIKQSILLGLDPEARSLYESGDRIAQRRVDEQINNAVRMMLNSDNALEQFQQLQNQVNVQMNALSQQETGGGDQGRVDIDTGGGVGGTTTATSLTPRGEEVSAHYNFGGYNTASWDNIYRSFLDQTLGGSPTAYKYAAQQGVGNDPLQRSAYTQFLLQATEDDPWAGNLTGDTLRSDGLTPGRVYSGIGDESDPTKNPYADFLSGYTPFSGSKLTNTVRDVIDTMKSFKTDFDQSGNTTYSDRDLRNFRWRDRFLYDSKADQNQQALAALPIMDDTPIALREETSNILGRLHRRWSASPNRNTQESWLEYVDRNNYFGMIDKAKVSSGETGG